jgi:hypothetical protein
MTVTIYDLGSDYHLLIEEETDPATLPEEIRAAIDGRKPWKTVRVEPGRPLIGLDPEETLRAIQGKGFHLQKVSLVSETIPRG